MPQFVKDIEEIRQRASRKIEEGAVTESYQGDVQTSIAILNEALATEIVCVLRYLHHYFMATGVHGRAVAGEFKEHADAEREHADLLAERIQQLGGKPDFNPKGLLERSASQYVEGETLADMIREDLIAERTVIEVYQEMIRHFANNDPTTRHMIEEILKDEEEHASDLVDLLYIADPHTGRTEGEDPGTRPLELEAGGKGGQKAAPSQRSQARGQQGAGSEIDARDAIEALDRMQEGRRSRAQEERGGDRIDESGDGSIAVEGGARQQPSGQRRPQRKRTGEAQQAKRLDSGSRPIQASRADQKTEQFAGRGSARGTKSGKKGRAA